MDKTLKAVNIAETLLLPYTRVMFTEQFFSHKQIHLIFSCPFFFVLSSIFRVCSSITTAVNAAEAQMLR